MKIKCPIIILSTELQLCCLKRHTSYQPCLTLSLIQSIVLYFTHLFNLRLKRTFSLFCYQSYFIQWLIDNERRVLYSFSL